VRRFTWITKWISGGIALVDANNVVVQFLSYEGFYCNNSRRAGMTSTDIGIAESSTAVVEIHFN
jgi:hypothetical protein